jgi:hypothetical protein
MALEIDGFDALLPVHDPVAISAAGGMLTDHRIVPMPHKDDIGLELVVRASVGQTHLCGPHLRHPYCSIVMRPGGLALPGTEPGLPQGHTVATLYEVYHPRLLAAAFRPSDAAPAHLGNVDGADKNGNAPESHPRGQKLGLLSRSLFAQRLAWRLHLAVVVHIVADSALEAPPGQSPLWPAPTNLILRVARDLSPCGADTPANLLRRLYKVAGSEQQQQQAAAFVAKMAQIAPAMVQQKLRARHSVVFNVVPQHRGSCSVADAKLSTSPAVVGLEPSRYRLKCRKLALRFVAPENTPLTAVLGILSHYKNRPMRDAMRKHLWRRAGPELADIRPVFLLDQPPLLGPDAEAVLREAEQERDVFFMPTLGLGRAVGFGRKLVTWFAMAPLMYPAAALLGKIDDDALPCLANFARVARQEKATPYLYWGWFHLYNVPAGAQQPPLFGYKYRDAAAKALKTTVLPRLISPTLVRSDEQFLVISRDLAVDIGHIGLPAPCEVNLADFGGTTIGEYVATARDTLRRPIHVRAGWSEMCHWFHVDWHALHCDAVRSYNNPLRVEADFCRRHLSAHPCKDVADVEPFYSHKASLHLDDGEVHP